MSDRGIYISLCILASSSCYQSFNHLTLFCTTFRLTMIGFLICSLYLGEKDSTVRWGFGGGWLGGWVGRVVGLGVRLG